MNSSAPRGHLLWRTSMDIQSVVKGKIVLHHYAWIQVAVPHDALTLKITQSDPQIFFGVDQVMVPPIPRGRTRGGKQHGHSENSKLGI